MVLHLVFIWKFLVQMLMFGMILISFGVTMGLGCRSNLGTCEVRDTPRPVSSSFPEPTAVIISPHWISSSSSPEPSLQAFVLSQGPVWSPSQRSQLQKQHFVSLASCQWLGSDRGSGCKCRTPLWPHLGRPQDSGSWEKPAVKPSVGEWKRYLSCQGQSRGPHEGKSEKLDIEFTCGGMNTMPIQAGDPWHCATLFLLFMIESNTNGSCG